MSQSFHPNSLWAVLRIQDQYFATPCEQVKSIIELTNVNPVPLLPKFMRGVINHRNQMIPVLEMRCRLGLKSLNAEVNEFVELMAAREQDHVNWINTLTECVQEKKKFTLATDPHQCKFGKWYDEFLPKTKDTLLKSLLNQFEKPHRSVHDVAMQVERLQHENHDAEAFQLIQDRKKHELRIMRNLFSDVKQTYRNQHREIAVIHQVNNHLAALVIDEVIAISRLSWDHWQTMNETAQSRIESNYMLGVAKIPEKELPVVVLDTSKFFA